MTEFLLLGVGWLLLSLPVSVLLGKCIAVGQAGETARHAAAETTRPVRHDGSAAAQASPAAAPQLMPAQRQPTPSRHMVR